MNVSPIEIESLPVNGRNFANLMTLSPGATSDGNGGWASVRFNGKSNQQNYISFDGVDGTFVWDASPGYLSATGSQFRLQTSMESVAEFCVNAGLAPAESGSGLGGNITVVSKSGSNAYRGLKSSNTGGATPWTPPAGQTTTSSPSRWTSTGGSIGGPIKSNKTFFFFSVENLKQTTGLSFTEAAPSAEAHRRVLAGEPVGSGAGQSPERTKAVALLLNGFPMGQVATSNPLVDLATLTSEAEQRETALSMRSPPLLQQPVLLRALPVQRRKGRYTRPDRHTAPRAGQGAAAEFGAQPPMAPRREPGQRIQGWPQSAGHERDRVWSGWLRSGRRIAVWRLHLVQHRRQRHDGHRAQRPPDRATSASSTTGSFDPKIVVLREHDGLDPRGAHPQGRSRGPGLIESDFQFLGSTEITFNSINDFIDNRPNQVAVNADSPVLKPQQFYLIGFLQDSWRTSENLTLELGVRYDYYSVVKEADGRAKPFFIEEKHSDPTRTASITPTRTTFRRVSPQPIN